MNVWAHNGANALRKHLASLYIFTAYIILILRMILLSNRIIKDFSAITS